jgi:hypothetical protein
MKVGDLIQTTEMIDVIGSAKEPDRGDIGFILSIRDDDAIQPKFEIYFPWLKKAFWLFDNEFKHLS